MKQNWQWKSSHLDREYYMIVTRPHDNTEHQRVLHKPFGYIRRLSYEDLLNKYYDYKEGLEDARAQADRWRY